MFIFIYIYIYNAKCSPRLSVIPEECPVPRVNECSVLNVLAHQKRRACSSDNALHLAPITTKIFNSSLRHQTVSLTWKFAKVSPIPKESPLNNCSQLRPISLTNIKMRIFEKFVSKQELSPALKSQIRSDQFAYEVEHNVTMALLKCQRYWPKWLDKDADIR